MKLQANCFSPFIGLQPHQNTGMLSYMYGVKCMLLDQFKRKSTPPTSDRQNVWDEIRSVH